MAPAQPFLDTLPLARQLLNGGPAGIVDHVTAAGASTLDALTEALAAHPAPRAALLAEVARLEHHLQRSLPGSGTSL